MHSTISTVILKYISDVLMFTVSAEEKKTPLKCGGAVTVWFRVFCLDTKT